MVLGILIVLLVFLIIYTLKKSTSTDVYEIVWDGDTVGDWGIGETLQLSKTHQQFYYRNGQFVSVDDTTKALGPGKAYSGKESKVISLVPLANAYTFSKAVVPGVGPLIVDGTTLGLSKQGDDYPHFFKEGIDIHVYPGNKFYWEVKKIEIE